MQQIIYETGFPALLYFYTPTNVDSSEKFEALWYCQSIEMFFWLWECLNFQGILAKFETAINQARSLVENEYFYTISEWDNRISSQNDLKLYIVAAVSEVSIVQYLWLLEEGRFQRLYWQTVCRKKNNTKEYFLQTIPGAMAIASQTNYRIKIFKKQRRSNLTLWRKRVILFSNSSVLQ